MAVLCLHVKPFVITVSILLGLNSVLCFVDASWCSANQRADYFIEDSVCSSIWHLASLFMPENCAGELKAVNIERLSNIADCHFLGVPKGESDWSES